MSGTTEAFARVKIEVQHAGRMSAATLGPNDRGPRQSDRMAQDCGVIKTQVRADAVTNAFASWNRPIEADECFLSRFAQTDPAVRHVDCGTGVRGDYGGQRSHS